MNHRDDDLEPALRAMLGDHHLDVRPSTDAVGTVLAGVSRARRRRATGYAAVTTFAVAAAIGAISLTGGDTPRGIEPVITPTTAELPTTAPSTPPPPTGPPPTTFATESTPPPTGPPVVDMLTPTGIGEIVLGMSLADAYGTHTLGMYDIGSDVLVPWDGSGAASVCEQAGGARRITSDGATVWMDDVLGVQEISISEPGTRTVDGIVIGMDLDEAVAMFPDVRAEEWGDPANGHFRYYVDNWLDSGNEIEIRWNGNGPSVVEYVMLRAPRGHGCYE